MPLDEFLVLADGSAGTGDFLFSPSLSL